ncbi:MAG TPA: hypothetical protein VNJ70_14275 [Thermoanaerobaculia bacterium]|nr:hypothetical protein [Thermoanaerobaculia bacterium]
MRDDKPNPDRGPKWRYALVLGLITLIYCVSFASVVIAFRMGVPPGDPLDFGDFATLQFSSVGIGLVLISLIAAAVALLGYDKLKSDLRKEVEASTSGRIHALEQELRGRAYAIYGLLLGALHLARTQADEEGDYLKEATFLSRKAYETLKNLEGTGKYMALNNLVYYSCLLGDESKADLLLQQARELRDVGQKYEDSAYISPYLLTFCRAVSTYGSDPKEIRQALSITEIVEKRSLTSLQKKEAADIAASLRAKLPEPSDGAR